MQILPVLDLLDGCVVRGIQGQRSTYRPVQSCLTESANALDVARAIRGEFGFETFYVADLDAILHGRCNEIILRRLVDDGFDLLVDAGLRSASDAERVRACGVQSVIAALETLPSPDALREIVECCGEQAVVFSLDLKNGQPLIADTAAKEWPRDTKQIAELAAECGCRRMIVLDLHAVGSASGVPTMELCRSFKTNPITADIGLITGGGIRDLSDLRELADAKMDGCLIASALHDGSVTRTDLLAAGWI